MKRNLFFTAVLLLGLMACTKNDVSVSVTGVTLSQSTVALTVSETVTLFAAVLPDNATNQNVTWNSNNTAVATVNANGVVTAVSPGTAIITVTTQDGGRTTTATVTVKEPAVLPTGVTLDRTAIILDINETITLIATVLPENATNQNVTWQSTNTSAATIDANGRVTARAEGSTTIIATTEVGGRTATATVTVNPPIIRPTGVELSGRTTILVGEVETFTVTISPANATNRNVTWISSNEAVATVDNTGKVSAITIGTATITVITEDGGYTASILIQTVTPTFDHGVVIDGIRWATRNVDRPGTFARNPEDTGMFYQWNRRLGWSSTDPLVNSNGGTWWDSSLPTGYTWEATNDPCPDGWRVPTLNELRSLSNPVSAWTTHNGIAGRWFGPNVALSTATHIFLPAAGFRDNSRNGEFRNDYISAVGIGQHGNYWSNTRAWMIEALIFTDRGVSASSQMGSQADGFTVRCVAAN